MLTHTISLADVKAHLAHESLWQQYRRLLREVANVEMLCSSPVSISSLCQRAFWLGSDTFRTTRTGGVAPKSQPLKEAQNA